jgi:hypothetical protein
VDGIIFGKTLFVLFFCLQLHLRQSLFCFSRFLVYYLDEHKQQGLLYGIVDSFIIQQQRKSLNVSIFWTVRNYSRIQTQNMYILLEGLSKRRTNNYDG